MTAAADRPGLSQAEVARLLAERAAADARAADAEQECERLRRDIGFLSRELVHERARVDVMQRELSRAGSRRGVSVIEQIQP